MSPIRLASRVESVLGDDGKSCEPVLATGAGGKAKHWLVGEYDNREEQNKKILRDRVAGESKGGGQGQQVGRAG